MKPTHRERTHPSGGAHLCRHSHRPARRSCCGRSPGGSAGSAGPACCACSSRRSPRSGSRCSCSGWSGRSTRSLRRRGGESWGYGPGAPSLRWEEERSHCGGGSCLGECRGHCQHRAGVCWAEGVHAVLHHHGGIGLEIITHRAEQGQGPCNLGVWTGRSQPLAIPGHDLFQELHNHGSRQWRGVRW